MENMLSATDLKYYKKYKKYKNKCHNLKNYYAGQNKLNEVGTDIKTFGEGIMHDIGDATRSVGKNLEEGAIYTRNMGEDVGDDLDKDAQNL